MTPFRLAAPELLNKGGCSVPMLGVELVKRKLVPTDHTIGSAYRIARETLDALAQEGKAQKWPDGYCYTLTDKSPIEESSP